MASIHKTFANSTQLPATDINGALNPDTADHIAYAHACGGTTVTFPANDTTVQAVTVSLPASRFTVAPNVVVQLNYAGGDSRYMRAWAGGSTATQLTICWAASQNLPAAVGGVAIVWQAIQMTPSSASG